MTTGKIALAVKWLQSKEEEEEEEKGKLIIFVSAASKRIVCSMTMRYELSVFS